MTLGIFIYPFTLRWGTSGAAVAGLVSVMVPLPYMFIAYKRANAER